MARTPPNPFIDDVFIDDPENLPGVEQIHRDAFSKLKEAIEVYTASAPENSPLENAGRTFLLTAPRAGYGKSHLIARLRNETDEIASSLVLPFQPATAISWTTTLDSFLAQSKRNPGDGNLFEKCGRHFLAEMVKSAVDGSLVSESDLPTDRGRLRDDYSNLFSRDSPGNIVDWTNERCHILANAFEEVRCLSIPLDEADANFWGRLFLDRELGDRSAIDRCIGLPEDEAYRKCLQFLRILASFRPLVLIVDGLEGFFSSASAGLEIATIVAGIRDEVPRTITVLCLNEEVWDSVFGDKIPSAYLDRLTGENSRLKPIAPEAAHELVAFRLGRIGVPGSAARKFSDRLADTHSWLQDGTKLTPREVLRQAREAWPEVGGQFDEETRPSESEDEDTETKKVYEVPLSELTDKAEFFADLQENGLPESQSEKPEPSPASPLAEEDMESTKEEAKPELPMSEPLPENPFFAAPSEPAWNKLDGIESIINDIRGSGSSVVSESPKGDQRSGTRPVPTIHAGPIGVTPTRNGSSEKTQAPPSAPSPKKTVDRKMIDRLIRENHRELLGGPPLSLDLVRIGNFLKAVGENHPGLSQSEEHLPGAQSVCLRWTIRGQSVLLGFESPKNVYFWNHLLQQSLSSNDREKISAFSHTSEVFDSDLFATFGFSPAVIKGRIDPIEMSDEELALLYAADSVLAEFRGSDSAPMAMQFITQQLDPLWRRIGQAV